MSSEMSGSSTLLFKSRSQNIALSMAWDRRALETDYINEIGSSLLIKQSKGWLDLRPIAMAHDPVVMFGAGYEGSRKQSIPLVTCIYVALGEGKSLPQ